MVDQLTEVSPKTALPELVVPIIESVDLIDFEYDPNLGSHINSLIQLKGFNRTERVSRRQLQEKDKKAGSSTDRPIAQGAVFGFEGFDSRNTLDQETATFKYLLPDSRGMALDENTLYLGSVNEVQVINTGNKSKKILKDDWLGFVHSLDLSQDHKKLLVASSGFDRILEFDLETGKPVWQWSAWEHGYNVAKGSGKRIITRQEEGFDPKTTIVITDPKKFGSGLGIPPADRAAFPNGVLYKDDNTILSTLYHNGLIEIDKTTGNVRQVFQDLKHPHAVLRYKDGYVVSDTAHGRCLFFDKDLRPYKEINFRNLPGKDTDTTDFEWLQYVKPTADGLLLAVDSNRATIFIIDPEKNTLNPIKVDQNWVIQETHEVTPKFLLALKETL